MSPREGVRFRPLLRVWRRQVDAYCDRHRLAPRHDDSNDDTRFTRNRVRRELIPLLEAGYNPRVREAILRLADAARDEHDIVVAAAASWLEGQGRLLDRASFNRLPPALRAEALRRHWAARAGLDQPAGDGARIAQALAVIAADGDGMIHLGAGFELLAHGAEFEICPREGPAPALGR